MNTMKSFRFLNLLRLFWIKAFTKSIVLNHIMIVFSNEREWHKSRGFGPLYTAN